MTHKRPFVFFMTLQGLLRACAIWVGVVLGIYLGAWLHGASGYEATARVTHYRPAHDQDLHTFQLHFGSQGGTVTLMGDGDLPVVQTLIGTKRVRVVLEPVTEERLER